MNFCRLPPERLRAAASGPLALTPNAAIVCAAYARTALRADESVRNEAAPRAVSSALSASDISGTAPRPSRSSGTKARPSRRRATHRAFRRACRTRRWRRRAPPCARRTVPRAAPSGRCPIRPRCRRFRRRAPSSEIDRSVVPNGSSARTSSESTISAGAPACASRCTRVRQLAADHHPRERRRRFLPRIAFAGHAARAQHRRALT